MKDNKFRIGLVLYTIVVLMFLIGHFRRSLDNWDLFSFSFIINFLIFWVYFFLIVKWRMRFPDRHRNILLLLIGNISAYTLNLTFSIFNVSTNWLAAFLVVLNASLLLYCFRKQLPEWVEYSLPAIFCAGIIFNKTKNLIFFFLIISVLTVNKSIAQKPIDSLLVRLKQICEGKDIPGAMISIVESDSIIYAGGIGYANKENQEPVTEKHLFRLGSISKSFTALGFVKLADEGKIKLSTPIHEIDLRSILSFIQSFKLSNERTIIIWYYRLTASALFILALWLLYNGIIGIRLWAY